MAKGYNVIETGWGYVVAVWSDEGLWELSFPRPEVRQALADITTPAIIEAGDIAMAAELERELKRYFAGFPVEFGVPVDWSGYTAFQVAPLKFAAGIPYGKVATYGSLAAAVGSPRAARAVGGAMHANRTPIVVPCHRVIGSNGGLTGFGGGLELKKALLLLEQG